MVADTKVNEQIYRAREPAVEFGEHTAIGTKTTTIEADSETDDFLIIECYEASDFDDAETHVTRVTPLMLHAMAVNSGRRSMHRGFQEAFKHLKKGYNG